MSGREEWILLSPPAVSDEERRALLAVFDSGWVAPAGPPVDGFERDLEDLLGRPTALVGSGTAALHLALIVSGIGPGDRVVVPSLTFAGSAFPVTYVGATPVFLDVARDHWTLDVDSVRRYCEVCLAAGGNPPRAVIAVDLYGQCADYDSLTALSQEYGFIVLSDAAESLGSTYGRRPAGSLGHFSVLSFNGNKVVTAAGGGALTGANQDAIIRARRLANQAREPVGHYEHQAIGYNYRISSLQAAVGRAQLRRLDEFVSRRRDIFFRYQKGLADIGWIDFMPQDAYGLSNCWLTCVLIAPSFHVGAVLAHLASHRIEARRAWKPMHMQPVFADAPRGTDMSVSEDIFARGMCLPSGSAMSDADVDRVVDVLRLAPER